VTKELPRELVSLIKRKKMPKYSAILMRIFKKEANSRFGSRITIGRFQSLKIFPISCWSGDIGPDAEDDALEAVLTCQPTTQAGIIALLEHMSAPSKDGTVLAFAFGADEDSPVYQAAADLPAMIAETLRSL